MLAFNWLISHLLVVVVVVEGGRYGDMLLAAPRLLNGASRSNNIPTELLKIEEFYMKFLGQQNGTDMSDRYKGGNVSTTCLQSLNVTLMSLVQKQPWALQFLDATGKVPAGLSLGGILWMGTFDQCVNTTAKIYTGPNNTIPAYPFKGQYCRVGIPLAPPADTGAVIGNGVIPIGALQIGLCVPSSCSRMDIQNSINAVLSSIPIQNRTLQAVTICQETEHKMDARAIFAITFFCILGVMVIIGTAYDVFVIHKLHANPEFEELDNDETAPLVTETPDDTMSHNIRHRGYSSLAGENGDAPKSPEKKQIQEPDDIGLGTKILQAFSLYTNGRKLLSTDTTAGSLGAVNGVRFLSMSWVILGHTYVFGLFQGNNTLPFMYDHFKRFSFLAILNATVSVDSFFLLSGLLVSYLSLKEMKKVGGVKNFRWGMYYFHRFWRLTPTYGLVMLLYIPLTKYLNSGPFWPDKGIEPHYCDDNWWMNLLYINNFFKAKNTCMAWSWYMANDMQFYIVSPLMLVPFYINGVFGGLVCMAFLAATFTTTGLISTMNHLPANLFGIGNENAIGNYFDLIYTKPYCRIGPYVIGVIYGYILYNTNCKRRLNVCYNLMGWLVAAVCCLSALYGNYQTIQGKHVMSNAESSLYTAVVPTVWSVGVGWVIYSCVVGSGGIVNGFLSWKLFIPLSRLTYLSYLIHPVLMEVFYGSLPQAAYFTDLLMVYYFLGHLVIVNGIAFVLSLVFESPFLGLEKALFRRTKRH